VSSEKLFETQNSLQWRCLAADSENNGSINLRHFSLVCENQSEVFCFVHFVVKFAAIFGPM